MVVISGDLSEERESKNPSGTVFPRYTFLPTFRDWILEEDEDLKDFMAVKSPPGLESRTEFTRLFLSEHNFCVEALTALLQAALAAETACLASRSWASLQVLEEDRFLKCLDRRRSVV